jgi:hypothetical protein
MNSGPDDMAGHHHSAQSQSADHSRSPGHHHHELRFPPDRGGISYKE